VPSWPISFPFPRSHLSPPARCSSPHFSLGCHFPHVIFLFPFVPLILHLYGRPYSSSTLPLSPTCTPRSMPLPPVSYPYPMAFLIWCHNTTSSSSPGSPPRRLLGLLVAVQQRSNNQRKAATLSECRVDRGCSQSQGSSY
jgi:hypothetical protein